MGIILKPFAWLLLFLYNLFNSYGLALILFAVIVKLILFPVTLKSKKSMIKTSMLSGKMQQLQRQYGKDRERYNIELQKLYEREQVNPMGGCLWSLIPMFVLIGLFYIIQDPLTYFMDLSAEQIQTLATSLNWQTVAVENGWLSADAMAKALEKVSTGFQEIGYNQLYLASLINDGNLAALQATVGSEKLFVMNFNFLGMDMSAIPTWKFWSGGLQTMGMFLIPLVSMAASFLTFKVTMATNKINNAQQANDQVDRTNKIMTYTMPLMSLWIGFTVPAGLSIYWIVQYLISMVQEVICGKMLKKDYEEARIAAEKREAEAKEEEKRLKEEARLERARRIEEEKNNKGKKKKSAQKKDVEPDQEGVNKDDSREGIRAYARGRAYIPNRFGGVTPYTDPNELIRAQEEAKNASKDKKKTKSAPAAEEKKEEEAPVKEQPVLPVQEAVQPAPAETEEIEVDVEEIEVEVDEDDNKEGV